VRKRIADALCTFELKNSEEQLDKMYPWTAVTASKDLAARRTYHTRLRANPAQRVIGRDLILPRRKFNTNGMIRKAQSGFQEWPCHATSLKER
jgi:hypothetical protein